MKARFLSGDYGRLYQQEQVAATLFNWFTAFTILVSTLGLLGLATFSAQQCTKEIGIRKVLGASLTSLVTLLSVRFIKPVILSCLLAVPLGFFVST